MATNIRTIIILSDIGSFFSMHNLFFFLLVSKILLSDHIDNFIFPLDDSSLCDRNSTTVRNTQKETDNKLKLDQLRPIFKDMGRVYAYKHGGI